MQCVKIVVAEDMVLIRRLLVQRLAQVPEFRIVGEAENGKEALELATQHMPDVVVMDLKMPVMDGITAAGCIRRLKQSPDILMLTSHDDLAGLARAAGVHRVLSKNHTPTELIESIRDAFTSRSERMRRASSSTEFEEAIDRLGMQSDLTEREIVVLHYVMRAELTAIQIATRLSTELNEIVTESAIKHTIERLMTKLHIEPRTRSNLVKNVLSQIGGAMY